MSRKLLIGSALSAAALSLSTAALPASDDGFSRGRSDTGVQGARPTQQSSQAASGAGDVPQNRKGAAPGERSGDALSGNPEPRFSGKPADPERLIDDPEKRDSVIARERSENVRPEPGISAPEPLPGHSVQDRSSEVR